MHILLVDDDAELADLLREYFAGHEVELEVARDGKEGLALLSDNAFDAVLLDVMLPGDDGFAVCKRIRATNDVPVIMLTARGDDTDRIVGLDLGADDYVPKPFNPRELLVAPARRAPPRARRSRERSRRASSSAISSSTSPRRRSPSARMSDLALTSFEFRLLVELARRAGSIVHARASSRTRSTSASTTPASIARSTSTSATSAQKLQDDARDPKRIRTVRGVGYVLVRPSVMFQRLGLRTRLFAWLIAAIVAGMAASTSAWMIVRSEVDSGPLRTMSRALGAEVTAEWDDPKAVDATIEHTRAATGADLKLRRDVAALPSSVRAHRTSLIFDGHECYVPIIHEGKIVGALEFPAEAPPGRIVRMIVFLCVALIVLAIAARSVSGLVVRPLEHVAKAAHKFGDGELDTRAGDDKHASPEVREVAKAFDTMATRVERMVRDQRDLLAAVSHELRSPLGRARVALELARDQGADAARDRARRSLAHGGRLDPR